MLLPGDDLYRVRKVLFGYVGGIYTDQGPFNAIVLSYQKDNQQVPLQNMTPSAPYLMMLEAVKRIRFGHICTVEYLH